MNVAMDSSRLHQAPASQTQLEQRDLLQYECNLAASYEAEYLLSLKIQEEMRQQRDVYNDPSEVTCFASVMTHASGGGTCGRSDGPDSQDFPMDCSAAMNSAATGNCSGLVNFSQAAQLQIVTDNVPCVGLFGREQNQQAIVDQEMDSEAVALGGFNEDQITHHDGPSRKRFCWNRTE